MIRVNKLYYGSPISWLSTSKGKVRLISSNNISVTNTDLNSYVGIELSDGRLLKLRSLIKMKEQVLGVVTDADTTIVHPYSNVAYDFLDCVDIIERPYIDMNSKIVENKFTFPNYKVLVFYDNTVYIITNSFKFLGLGETININSNYMSLFDTLKDILICKDINYTKDTRIIIDNKFSRYELVLNSKFLKFVAKLRLLSGKVNI